MPGSLLERKSVETKKCLHPMHPSVFFLVITIFVTACATSLLCVAIMTDYWEIIKFDRNKVEAIARRNNQTHELEWLFDGSAGRVTISRPVPSYLRSESSSFDVQSVEKNYPKQRTKRETSLIFLVPMHGGIWTLCVSLGGKC